MEAWLSGRKRWFRKPVYPQGYRGFESYRLRQAKTSEFESSSLRHYYMHQPSKLTEAEEAAENRASFVVAQGEVQKAIASGIILDHHFIEMASATVHARWLERNDHRANPTDHLSYNDLPEAEKEKDRHFVQRAIAETQQKIL